MWNVRSSLFRYSFAERRFASDFLWSMQERKILEETVTPLTPLTPVTSHSPTAPPVLPKTHSTLHSQPEREQKQGPVEKQTVRREGRTLAEVFDVWWDWRCFSLHQSSESCRRENGLSDAAQRQTDSLQMTVRSGTATLTQKHKFCHYLSLHTFKLLIFLWNTNREFLNRLHLALFAGVTLTVCPVMRCFGGFYVVFDRHDHHTLLFYGKELHEDFVLHGKITAFEFGTMWRWVNHFWVNYLTF